MWSLVTVAKTTEVMRVYIGSFWDQPYAAPGKENEKLFEAETAVFTKLICNLKALGST